MWIWHRASLKPNKLWYIWEYKLTNIFYLKPFHIIVLPTAPEPCGASLAFRTAEVLLVSSSGLPSAFCSAHWRLKASLNPPHVEIWVKTWWEDSRILSSASCGWCVGVLASSDHRGPLSQQKHIPLKMTWWFWELMMHNTRSRFPCHQTGPHDGVLLDHESKRVQFTFNFLFRLVNPACDSFIFILTILFIPHRGNSRVTVAGRQTCSKYKT